MIHRTLAAVLMLLAVGPSAWAKLEIRNLVAASGPFGPKRESLELLPGDELYFRFQAHGVAIDGDGRVNVTLETTLTDQAGKVLSHRSVDVRDVIAFGGDFVPCRTSVAFGLSTKPAKYHYEVRVRDNVTGETASFERVVTCRQPGFGIVRSGFFYDTNERVPAPPRGVIGQPLRFRLQVVGFDKSQKKIHVSMEMQTQDGLGKPLMPKPLRAVVALDDADQVARAEVVNFRGFLTLNRAGDFKVRIVVRDEISGQEAVFESPIHASAAD